MRRAAIATLGFATLTLAPAAQAASCPNVLDGQHRSQTYSFKYQTWLQKEQTSGSNLRYRFGGTFENRGPKTLWFDWPELNRSGFLPPNASSPFDIADPTGECDIVSTDIWYGDLPAKLSDVKAIRPLAKGLVATVVRALSEKIKGYFEGEQKVFATSRATLFVPMGQDVPPKEFARVHATFFSEVSQGDYKMGLSLVADDDDIPKLQRYFAAKPPSGILFSAVTDDAFIASTLATTRVSFPKKAVTKNPEQVFEYGKLTGPPAPIYRVGRITFIDSQQRLIGSMPVTILEPGAQLPAAPR